MRVLTYNIHGWKTMHHRPNLASIAALLENIDADVIGLNEVYHPEPVEEGVALPWLAERLRMHYAFGACLFTHRPNTTTPIRYGNALLSRYPFRFTSSGLFIPLPDKQQRGYLEAQLDLGHDQTITVVVTHLDHTEEAARRAQLDSMFEANAGWPWDVVMGDFNCIHPQDYVDRPDALVRLASHPRARHLAANLQGPWVAEQMENQGFTDAVLHRGLRGPGTFVRADEPARMDFIWVAPTWWPRLTHAEIVEEEAGEEASDHRPVWVEFGVGGG